MTSDHNSYLLSRLTSARLGYDQLFSEASEVVVFGSRAAGVNGPDSDLDLLVITPRMDRIYAAGLDFVLLLPEDATGMFWCGSELASHISQYGKWLKGSVEWRQNVRISRRAVLRKRQRVTGAAVNAFERWSRLHPVFQTRYSVTLRRELQRLDLLMRQIPITPTPMLDAEWQAGLTSTERLLSLLHDLPLISPVPHFIEQLLARDSKAVPAGR